MGAVRESRLARQARFKNDVNKATTLAKTDKDAAKKDPDLLMKVADTVKSPHERRQAGDGRPAAAPGPGGEGRDVRRRTRSPP